jgi:phosphonate transport system permease protein
MSLDTAPAAAKRGRGGAWAVAVAVAVRWVLGLLAIAIVVQMLVVVEARPQDLLTGAHGMADLIRRAMPPDFAQLPAALWPTLQTIDIALFGTMMGIALAVPLALLAAANMTPSRYAYYAARAVIGLARPTWSGRCCSSLRSGSARSRVAWRLACTRWACSAGCLRKRSSRWTWRRSRRWS